MRYLNSGIFQHEVLEYVKGNNDVQKDVLKELTDRQKVIVEMIIANPFLSAKTISEKMSEKMSERCRKRCRKRKVSMREPSKGILPN